MLLTEPGSRIEGPTEDVLRSLFWSLTGILLEHGLTENETDALALRFTARAHQSLADGGYVVRHYAGE